MVKNDRERSRREEKKLETRQSLLEAAFRLFSEDGYEATTVEDITDAVGVAKGTFFNYFAAKEAVLPAIAADRLRRLASALTPERGPRSPVARIKLALRLVANDPLCERQLGQRLFSAIMRRRGLNPGHTLRDLLAEQVGQGQASGEIREDVDPIWLAGAIQAVFFHQLAMWHDGHRPGPLEDMIDAAVDLLMEGAAGPDFRP